MRYDLSVNPVDLATAIRAHVDHARRNRADGGRALDALDALAEELAPVEGPLKVCSCGASYDAAAWAALPLVGVTDDGTERVEQRNCTAHPERGRCMSTLGVVVGPSAEPAPAAPYPWLASIVERAAELPVEPPPPAGPGAPPAEPPSRRTCASSEASAAPAEGTPPPACEGCGGPLSEEQLSRGAKACSGACRARASRDRARAARLRAIDAAAAALAEARREIAGG